MDQLAKLALLEKGLRPYLVATLLLLIAHAIKLTMPYALVHQIPFLIYFSVVVLSGAYGGLGPGLYATATSAFLAEYYFLPPAHSFVKEDWHQYFKLALYAFDCITISALCGSLRRALLVTKRTSAEGRAARARLEAIFAISPASMALWRGEDLIFEMVNPQYHALFGDRPLLGKPFLEALPEFRGQPFGDLILGVMRTGIPFVGREVLAQHAVVPGGALEDRYYDFTYVRLEGDHGETLGVYDHAIDVTDRVLAQRALEKSWEELASTVKELEVERELRERFVAALTHDLRTPITSAKLTAQLLARGLENAEQREKAKRIAASMDRADHMIRDLLDASRIKAGERLPVNLISCDLNEVAREAMKDLASIHGDRFFLESNLNGRGNCDPDAIRRILDNLGSNAVKYGAKDAPVTIRLQNATPHAIIEVHNQGREIPAEKQSDLFQIFRRSDEAERGGEIGWGVGLSLVYGLTKAHGGSVGVKSRAGQGTTFQVRIPYNA